MDADFYREKAIRKFESLLEEGVEEIVDELKKHVTDEIIGDIFDSFDENDCELAIQRAAKIAGSEERLAFILFNFLNEALKKGWIKLKSIVPVGHLVESIGEDMTELMKEEIKEFKHGMVEHAFDVEEITEDDLSAPLFVTKELEQHWAYAEGLSIYMTHAELTLRENWEESGKE